MLLALPILLAAGVVQTRGGKTFHGELTLSDNAVLVRPAGASQAIRIGVSEIHHLLLKPVSAPRRIVSSSDSPLPVDFTSQDIGSVRRPGSATCDPNGLFTIRASGYGAWGPRDSFHLASTPMSGDGQIIARLTGVDDSHGQMVAGIMIRQNLAPDATMAGTTIYPAGEVRLSRRPQSMLPEFRNAADPGRRPWLRLTRNGDRFAAYCSADGMYWDFVDSQTIPMQDPVLIGLGAWTTSNTSLGQVQFDSILIIPGPSGATWFENGPPLIQGIVLRDGNSIAATIVSTDQNTIQYLRNGQPANLPLATVARIVFNPLPRDQQRIRGKKGLWLVNGDFIEGKLSPIQPRPPNRPREPLQIGITSVLFGIKNFDATQKVMAAVLADVNPAPAAFEIHAADGSVRRIKDLTIRNDAILADGTTISDVIEIVRQ